MKADPALFEKVEGDADTLAGLLLEIKGEFPVLHERLDYGNYHFEVLEMNTRRILKVKVIVDSSSSVEEEKEIDFIMPFIPYLYRRGVSAWNMEV